MTSIQGELDDSVLQDIYMWVDSIPLSRVKRNISRDFSDGVCVAEIIKHFSPKLVNLHSLPPCNSSTAKKKNWELLNWKVFRMLNFELSEDIIAELVAAKPGTIEKVLLLLRAKLDEHSLAVQKEPRGHYPESEQVTGVNKLRSKSFNSEYSSGDLNKSERISTKKPRVTNQNNAKIVTKLPSDLMKEEAKCVTNPLYDDKVQECLLLEETVEILNAKVRRLEHLVRLKDTRIQELRAALEKAGLN